MRAMTRCPRWASALALLFLSEIGFAQSNESNPRVAQSLFDRARALMTEGRYAEACPLFAESQKLDPGGGTLLNLALCHEKEGRTATAWTEYQEALSLAIRDGRDDRKQIADERIGALRGKIPSVVIELPPNVDTSGWNLTIDGSAIPKVALGAAFPIDPGEHTLVTAAPGHVARSERFAIAASETKRLRVATLDPTAKSDSVIAPSPTAAPIPVETRLSGASWIVGGIGGALVLASGVTGVLALLSDRQSKDHVDNAGCVSGRDFCKDPNELDQARSAHDRARTLAWVSTGALMLGAAGVTTAFLLPREPVSAQLRPVGRGFELGATFSSSF
jgi:tetratricopeptide (TPR) repeat protein